VANRAAIDVSSASASVADVSKIERHVLSTSAT
jgi:hypothetical protein